MTRDIRPNTPVVAADGPVGYVEHLVVDERSGAATGLVVTGNGKAWLVPLSAVIRSGPDRIVLAGVWSEYEQTGAIRRDALQAPETVRSPRHASPAAAIVVERHPGGGHLYVDGRELAPDETISIAIP